MARVLTNSTGLRVAIEPAGSIGADPTGTWSIVEFDTIGAYGAVITTVVRRPISQDRGRKKGTVVDLDSTVDFETDLTFDAFQLFGEGFMFAEYRNTEFFLPEALMVGAALDVTAVGYELGATLTSLTNGDLLETKILFTAASAGVSLFFAKGYAIAGNNGLKDIDADPVGGDTDLTFAGLAIETAPLNATVELCGIRVADADMTLVESSGTATLTSAGDVVSWAARGVVPGMMIHIGSMDAAGVVQNALQDTTGGTSDDTFGFARVASIPSALVLNLDKLDPNIGSPTTADNTGEGVADIMFGRFLRNVPVTSTVDDARFIERTYQFEASYPELGGVGVPEFEYAVGNFENEIAFNAPLTEKATISFGFIGTNSDDITPSRKSGAATALSPLRTTAFNTSSSIASITTDVVSLVSDVCFKSLTFTILNNVSPEKCLGTLGAVFVNAGLFEANLEGQMLFTNRSIVNAIKNNTTVTFAAIFVNEDGAIAIDMPELTLSGGGREFPVDQSVLVNITGASFTSSTFGYDIGITLLAAVPGVITDS